MYLDSAIIVKLLVEEPDTAFMVQALVGHTLSSSELAAPEVLSALLGKERKKLITKPQRIEAWRIFNERVQSGDITLRPLSGVVLKKANHVLERCHPAVALRTPRPATSRRTSRFARPTSACAMPRACSASLFSPKPKVPDR